MKVLTVASSVLLLCRPSSSTRLNDPTAVVNDGDSAAYDALSAAYDAGSAAYDDGSSATDDESTAAFVGIPVPIPEAIYPKIPDEVLEPFFPIDFCREEGRTWTPPVSTNDMNDAWFEENTAGVGYALEQYQPEVVVIIGGSSGIGRANACYWAAQGKTVLSLGQRPVHLIGENQPTKIICDSAQRIINVQYDIAHPHKQRKLAAILEEHGITKIDYLLLGAGRFLVGNMRDWTFDDMQNAYNTNVFGLHEVWRQLREYLNPDFAVVFGIASQMAENQFFALASVYAHTKKSIYDMMIAYAQEEVGVQPNTHYAAIVEGACGTSVNLNYISPAGIKCQAEYAQIAVISNVMWQFNGLKVNEIARLYHKAYARIAAAKTLNPEKREDIPMSFTFVAPESFLQTEPLLYNNRMLRPEETLACYSKQWDLASKYVKGGCRLEGKKELPLCPIPEDLILPFLDPRVPLVCSEKS